MTICHFDLSCRKAYCAFVQPPLVNISMHHCRQASSVQGEGLPGDGEGYATERCRSSSSELFEVTDNSAILFARSISRHHCRQAFPVESAVFTRGHLGLRHARTAVACSVSFSRESTTLLGSSLVALAGFTIDRRSRLKARSLLEDGKG